eukprot:6313359-Pyramimonas_sp.AAC.1
MAEVPNHAARIGQGRKTPSPCVPKSRVHWFHLSATFSPHKQQCTVQVWVKCCGSPARDRKRSKKPCPWP